MRKTDEAHSTHPIDVQMKDLFFMHDFKAWLETHIDKKFEK
jgi:hypothetical protein